MHHDLGLSRATVSPRGVSLVDPTKFLEASIEQPFDDHVCHAAKISHRLHDLRRWRSWPDEVKH